MNRRFLLHTLAAVMYVAAAAATASAQSGARTHPTALAHVAAVPQANVHGIVLDDRGRPLAGAVVSALGSTTSFTVSDEQGRFAFHNLPYGPYLMRAHLQGYVPPRAQMVQVNRASLTVSAIALTRHVDGDENVDVLAAGVGTAEVAATAGADDDSNTHDHGEVAWRLRHLKRSVLKDAAAGVFDNSIDSLLGESLAGLGWAVGTPAKAASSFFADVPWNGHFDLLTSTSFDAPQDLWSPQTWVPRGIAFLSLEAPTTTGRWDVRGAVTQGDLSSWIVAGSYRRVPATHRYEAGFSYGMQHDLGSTADPRSTMPDGGRNVGSVYAYDDWMVTSRLSVTYGAKYGRYDYLAERGLFSPRASVTVMPVADDTFKVRAAVSRHVEAPGAEEFLPPSSGLWLPPERTFSSVSPRRGFTPERLDHVELAAEREWAGDIVTSVRAFRQRVDDQIVTLFGIALPGSAAASLGHYYVATAGDVDARGWGVGVSRTVAARLRASIDYTQVTSRWLSHSPDAAALALIALPIGRGDQERFHDLTTSIDTRLPVTATRLFLVYKLNSRFADLDPSSSSRMGARFDVQLNQALPFLSFAGGEWEMLAAVRNLFREELLDLSVYDELLVIRPPKRVVGGVTVKF